MYKSLDPTHGAHKKKRKKSQTFQHTQSNDNVMKLEIQLFLLHNDTSWKLDMNNTWSVDNLGLLREVFTPIYIHHDWLHFEK